MIRIENVTKEYSMGKIKVPALSGVDLVVPEGQFVAVMGPSGSGKSTLMNIIGCLDRPTSGTYYLNNTDVSKKSDNELAEIRNKHIGFIFQTFNLLPRTDALANVELPLIYRGLSPKLRREKAIAALEAVALSKRIRHRPNEMSGGEQQRVAIARALAGDPNLILADEPTGNLDTRAGEEVMVMFQQFNRRGITLILVTHDPDIARHADRIITLRDGKILGDEIVPEPLVAEEVLAGMAIATD